MKRTAFFLLISSLALSLSGCALSPKPAHLIGHSTGAAERSWKFQSLDQIRFFHIIAHTNANSFIAETELHNPQGDIYLAHLLLTYKSRKLQSVGLLYLEKW